MFYGICCRNVKLASWLIQRIDITKETLGPTISRGLWTMFTLANIDTVDWFVQEFGVTASDVRSCDNLLFRLCIVYNRVDSVIYLIDKFDLGAADTFGMTTRAITDRLQRISPNSVSQSIVEKFGVENVAPDIVRHARFPQGGAQREFPQGNAQRELPRGDAQRELPQGDAQREHPTRHQTN